MSEYRLVRERCHQTGVMSSGPWFRGLPTALDTAYASINSSVQGWEQRVLTPTRAPAAQVAMP